MNLVLGSLALLRTPFVYAPGRRNPVARATATVLFLMVNG